MLDAFESVEGLSGTRFNDILTGTIDTFVEMGPIPAGGAGGFLGSYLDAEGIALINGLQALLGAGVTNGLTNGDIILGGDGSDVITGLAGDDVIDGDKWLDVQIGVFDVADLDHTGPTSSCTTAWTSLTQQVFSGVINPGQLSIVRTIRDSNDQPDSDGIFDVDVAVFSGVMADYVITSNLDGSTTVVLGTTARIRSGTSSSCSSSTRLRTGRGSRHGCTARNAQWNGLASTTSSCSHRLRQPTATPLSLSSLGTASI